MPKRNKAKNLASPGLRIVKYRSLEGLCIVSSDEEDDSVVTVLATSLEEMMKLAVSEMDNKRVIGMGELLLDSSMRILLVRI